MTERAVGQADVAIVGAGAAGCLLAILLGRAGLRVVVLERGERPPFNGADFLKPSGLRVLGRHGLAGEIARRHALRRTRIRYYHDGAPIIDYDYARHTDVGHYLIVPYATTMGVLLETMAGIETVELRVQAGVAEVQRAGDRVETLVLDDGQRVRAAVVVGADGARSMVRAAMGLHEEPEPYDQDVYMGTFPAVPSAVELNRLYISSRRWMVYIYPATSTLFRIGVSLPATERAAIGGPPSGLLDRIRPFVSESDDALAALSELSELSAFTRMPTTYMNASRYFRGNMAVLGDAAHCAHPVTGQGMNLSFEDAEALSACLVAYFAGRVPLEAALDRYTRLRRPVNERIIAYGNTLLRSFESKDYYMSHFDILLHGSMYDSEQL